MLRAFHLRNSIRDDIQVPEREEYEGIRMTFAVMSNFTPLDNPQEMQLGVDRSRLIGF
jgi:hypothetical protein